MKRSRERGLLWSFGFVVALVSFEWTVRARTRLDRERRRERERKERESPEPMWSLSVGCCSCLFSLAAEQVLRNLFFSIPHRNSTRALSLLKGHFSSRK